MRTTSQLENYNGQLNKKFQTNGNFFHFLDELLKEECTVVREMTSVVAGRAKKHKESPRDALIKSCSTELAEGIISSYEFIKRMAYKDNDISCNLANFPSAQNESIMTDESVIYNDVIEESPMAVSREKIIESKCCICLDRIPNSLLMPCKHLKTSNECTHIQRNIQAVFKCPFCQTVVSDVIVAFV